MDDIYRQLLTLLRHNGRRSISDLAGELGLSRATVRARIERMEAQGDIIGYTVILKADAIAMPVRGNHTLSAYTARLKMWSSMSSIHRFSIAAHFADGSTRESKPVTFFFFRPKQSLFESKSEPTACYLPREINGCG